MAAQSVSYFRSVISFVLNNLRPASHGTPVAQSVMRWAAQVGKLTHLPVCPICPSACLPVCPELGDLSPSTVWQWHWMAASHAAAMMGHGKLALAGTALAASGHHESTLQTSCCMSSGQGGVGGGGRPSLSPWSTLNTPRAH